MKGQRAPTPQWSGFCSFKKDQLELHPNLLTPPRFLWRAYKAYCTTWGFPQSDAIDFMQWLREIEGVTIMEGGKGRLRSLACGLALKGE